MRVTRNYPTLRLVVSRDVSEDIQTDLCRESSLSAASPRGALVRPHSISLIEDAVSPTRSPISLSVKPVERRSEMRDAHVVMQPSLRNSEITCQRKTVTAFRNNSFMPRPKDMPNLDSVGRRIRWWREYRKMSQGELAKGVKISQGTLSDLENDRQAGSGKLHLMAAKLGLNPHYLETGKGEPEADFPQEPQSEPVDWPFESISPAKLAKLNMIERSYAETKLLEALAEIEAERRKSKKSG